MSFSSKTLPENIRKCMPKDARAATGITTMVEVAQKADRGQELKLHAQFEDWCRLNNIPFVHSRTDRKSTIATGHPDFTLLRGGRGCCVEFKAPGGQLSPDQVEKLRQLEEAKVACLVTSSVAEAIQFTKQHLL